MNVHLTFNFTKAISEIKQYEIIYISIFFGFCFVFCFLFFGGFFVWFFFLGGGGCFVIILILFCFKSQSTIFETELSFESTAIKIANYPLLYW